MKKSLIGLVLMSVCSMAYATQPGTSCNGNGSCGETYNTTNNTSNQGGAGGQGGNGGNSSASAIGTGGNATGGSASAVGVGGSADVRNSSTNLNANTNKVDSTNIQGQQQGQGQSQAIKNSGNSSSSSGVNSSGNNTGNSTVTVEGDTYEAKRIPVSTAYANSPLPSATCRTGGAVGIQVMGFGGSFGGDRAVDTCEINEAARIAAAIGQGDMALEIFCQNKWAKKATQCQAIAVEE